MDVEEERSNSRAFCRSLLRPRLDLANDCLHAMPMPSPGPRYRLACDAVLITFQRKNA
jgi:hypothetical protein